MALFRRRRLGPRWGPGPQAMLRLQEAHALLARGEFVEAAHAFETLAGAAETLGLPRAANLHLQAGRAWVEAGQTGRGLQHLRRGLSLAAQMGQMARLPAVTARVLTELRARGLTVEAEALQREVQAALAAHGLSLASVAPAAEPRLPAKCPHCGGTVHPSEVEWSDPRSALCAYCGSLLNAGS